MNDNHADLQRQILTKLMFVTGCKYSELERITDNHDLFNYHLKELQHKGLAVKNGPLYQLTEKGRQVVALMEENGELQRQIKVGLFIDLLRKEHGKDQLLLHKRLKHPHYGYSGAVTGKLKWGQTLEENLRRELMEEIQITPVHYQLIGTVRELFRNEDREIVGDGVYFVYVVDKWLGDVRFQSNEGEYYWYDIDRILELDKIFRSGFEKGLPHLNRYLTDPEQFSQYVHENGSDGLKF